MKRGIFDVLDAQLPKIQKVVREAVAHRYEQGATIVTATAGEVVARKRCQASASPERSRRRSPVRVELTRGSSGSEREDMLAI